LVTFINVKNWQIKGLSSVKSNLKTGNKNKPVKSANEAFGPKEVDMRKLLMEVETGSLTAAFIILTALGNAGRSWSRRSHSAPLPSIRVLEQEPYYHQRYYYYY
jgi:hypothetical protein